MTNRLLIDVCGAIQYPIDYKKVIDSGVEGVYVQSSLYSGSYSNRFHQVVDGFRQAGLNAVGAYHFCSQASDPIKQSEFFYEASGGLGGSPGELPPLYDFEFCKNLSCATCVSWLETALARGTELWYPDNYKALLPNATDEEKYMYRLPVVYTYPWFAASHQPNLGQSKVLGKYPLHLAAYKTKNGVLCPWMPADDDTPETALNQRTPAPWTKPLLWQYSGNKGEKVPGIAADTDRDLFLGSSADWDKFRGIYRPADSIELPVKD